MTAPPSWPATASPSQGSEGPEGQTRGPLDASRALAHPRRRQQDERSLAEMMRDDGELADAGITSMVARVGRWWYSRCYESATIAASLSAAAADAESGGAASSAGGGGGGGGGGNKKVPTTQLWNDRALLAECEERGTSLKLTVCYARVPESKARSGSI